MLRVTDLDRSIKFYTEALGCTLIRTRDNPENKYKLAFLGSILTVVYAPREPALPACCCQYEHCAPDNAVCL